MKMLKKFAGKLIRDESGQSTTEYVLLLVMVVVAVKKVGTVLNSGLSALVNQAFNKANDAVQSAETN